VEEHEGRLQAALQALNQESNNAGVTPQGALDSTAATFRHSNVPDTGYDFARCLEHVCGVECEDQHKLDHVESYQCSNNG